MHTRIKIKISNMLRFIIVLIASLLLIVGCKKSVGEIGAKAAYFDTLVISNQEYKVYTILSRENII